MGLRIQVLIRERNYRRARWITADGPVSPEEAANVMRSWASRGYEVMARQVT